MAEGSMERGRDLVLAHGEFAFVLDMTKGLVNVIVGPNKTSMSNTDQPVRWEPATRRFARCDIDAAVQPYPNAPEGFYVVLTNPMDGKDEHPREGVATMMPTLKMGRRANIPGPTYFPLWPGQTAKVIEGHHLRSNQYLVVRIYNDEEARTNWGRAVVKPQTQTVRDPGSSESGATESAPVVVAPTATTLPQTFTMGQLMVIKGTDVAFFIPPTGVEVIPEKTGAGETYVREAVTLERLEYCILLDENGKRRYVRGPDVVFPEPTETFVTAKDGSRKFRAIELNENIGIYVKVIADYEEGGTQHKVGDELFITGKDTAIYFPREEHSIIRYGNQMMHYAVAIPAGEGRYVLNRNTGDVRLVKGPIMLLPDPRKEVIVRRVFDTKTVELLYPGNRRAIEVNEELAELSKGLPPGEYLEANTARRGVTRASTGRDTEDEVPSDTFSRAASFTPPRTITLNTKFDGAVAVDVWTGYAVLVVDKSGKRRVVQGPDTILLEYDETLMPMELSTGKPKTDDDLLRTVYLRVRNNRVSDIVDVETKDLVEGRITLSYRVNFEGDRPEQWFAVENYVKFLVDHLRSMIRNAAKRYGIEEFYEHVIDIVRDTVLSKSRDENDKRPGRVMEENGMRVYDVEVLDVAISNDDVEEMLTEAQTEALRSALRITREERDLETTKRSEEIKRGKATAIAETAKATAGIEQEGIRLQLETSIAKITADAEANLRKQENTAKARLQEIADETAAKAKRLESQLAEQAFIDDISTAELKRKAAASDQEVTAMRAKIEAELQRIKGETDEIVKRAQAVSPELATALTVFGDQTLIEKISTALAPHAIMTGVSAADILAQLFKGTPFEGVMKALGTRTRVQAKE